MEADVLRGGTAIIIDILRASSTMVTALHNGAAQVIPCSTPDDAFAIRDLSATPENFVLGGERGGIRIPGFHYGNSPAEYCSEAVNGRTVLFTTTNGTKALLSALDASEILVGAFLNRRAIIERLARERKSTHLICAGTDGVITGEDVLFAGAVVDGLLASDSQTENTAAAWQLNDCAEIALGFWRQNVTVAQDSGSIAEFDRFQSARRISETMLRTKGGRNLLALGYEADIGLCSQLDTIVTIPQFDPNLRCLLPAE